MIGFSEILLGNRRKAARRLRPWVCVALAIAPLAGACGSAGVVATRPPATAPTLSSGSTPDTAESSTPVDSVGNGENVLPIELPSLEDLRGVVDATTLLPRMSFELDVTSTIPGSTAYVTTRRTGSFDDETLGGIATRTSESEEPALKEMLERSFEIRIVDEVYWMKVTDGIDEHWSGFKMSEFSTYIGGDASAAADGDLLLGALLLAAEDVVGYEALPDGGCGMDRACSS